jgi:glycosyltransferase involved in cell wall biosynthesis
MRIAQVSPLFERVPPVHYGGTERVVSFLTEELVLRGHDVTLFASADARTAANLVAVCPHALRIDSTCRDPLAYHVLEIEHVARLASQFDIVHFHTGYLHFPTARRLRAPHVTTLHGRLDLPELAPLFQEFSGLPLISISGAQREPFPSLNWRATVHHGLPADLYAEGRGDGGYLLFLGRVSPEKRPDRAIEIARRAGRRLLIAAKVDHVDRAYYDATIAPLIDGRTVEFLGEVGDEEKQALLGGAEALLFPIDWPEPFGVVLIEALACGTPIVAWNRGSVPEIVEHGLTGFLIDSIEAAVIAADRARTLPRADIRRAFEERFTIERVVDDHLAVYSALVGEASPKARTPAAIGAQDSGLRRPRADAVA